MLDIFLPCASPGAPFRSMVSLNTLVEDGNSGGDSKVERIDLIVDPSPSLFEVHEEAQRIAGLPHFLATLPPCVREIVKRHFWLGHPQTKIANDLGITPSAVCHRLAVAKNKGRKFYKSIEQ